MRFKPTFWLLLLCTISVASAAVAQTPDADQSSKNQLTTTLKDKIQQSLDSTEEDSLITYNQKGHALKEFTLSSEKIENSFSLAEFLKKDPIATCEDPKALKPPPQCVVCKNGHIICTRAKFGEQISADSDTKQKQ